MSTAVHAEPTLDTREQGALAWLKATSGAVSYALLGFVLLFAFFEGWLLIVLERHFPDAVIIRGLSLDGFIRGLRNVAYLGLGLSAIVRVASVGGWRHFLKPVDLVFVALLIALLIAAVAGDSSLTLTAHGIFVYIRGAIVLYAVRALAPAWSSARPLFLVVGALVFLHVGIAVAQVIAGPPLYDALGFSNLSWAEANRAQGLFSHPNHLGHVTGLALLAALCLFLPRPGARWWVLVAALALGLALAQSRESLIAALAGIGGLFFLQSGRTRRVFLALAIVIGMAGVAWTLQPGSWEALAQKVRGVISAVEVPSGSEPARPCDPALEECTPSGVPSRSIRVLYYQQGLRLWLESPIIGYGVGQFGGGVASQHNPEWYLNPRFGPEGFDMHNFEATQVDSFWLHLLVETGALGLAAYLAWLALLGLPSVRRTWRSRAGPRGDGAREPDWPRFALERYVPLGLVFAFIVAGLSPALEDRVFPPLLFASIGLVWSLRARAEADASRLVAAEASPR